MKQISCRCGPWKMCPAIRILITVSGLGVGYIVAHRGPGPRSGPGSRLVACPGPRGALPHPPRAKARPRGSCRPEAAAQERGVAHLCQWVRCDLLRLPEGTLGDKAPGRRRDFQQRMDAAQPEKVCTCVSVYVARCDVVKWICGYVQICMHACMHECVHACMRLCMA